MNSVTLPGLIDIHVHLRDPGQTEKEDFTTGTEAALAGGFTVVADMPNNKEPIFTFERLMRKREIARDRAHCTVLFYFGTLGDNLSEFPRIYEYVSGLKVYLDNTTGGFILPTAKLRAVYAAWEVPKPILAHCENEHIHTLIDIVRQTRKQTHICHIHSITVLRALIDAKMEGLPITCGVTPHHLLLTTADEARLGPYGKMKPPLPAAKDQQFFWDNLDAIDVVESDHAPHTKQEKESAHPPYGVTGLETTLPLLLEQVYTKRIPLAAVKRLLYEGPRKILHIESLDTGSIEVDLDEAWVIRGEQMQTKCKWTPFEGMTVHGKIVKHHYSFPGQP